VFIARYNQYFQIAIKQRNLRILSRRSNLTSEQTFLFARQRRGSNPLRTDWRLRKRCFASINPQATTARLSHTLLISIIIQGKGIYKLCSRQSTKKLFLSARKNISFNFLNNHSRNCLTTAHAVPHPLSPCTEISYFNISL
jgi:hypothetical protein